MFFAGYCYRYVGRGRAVNNITVNDSGGGVPYKAERLARVSVLDMSGGHMH